MHPTQAVVFHQFRERNWLDMNGLLRQSIEKFAAWRQGAGGKAEGKLVEIIVQMLGRHYAMVGSHQPAFQKSNDAMHTRQYMLVFGLFCLDMALVGIALQPRKPSVRTEPRVAQPVRR